MSRKSFVIFCSFSLAAIMLVSHLWLSIMHNLARMYESCFLCLHYDCEGFSDPTLVKRLSYHEKILCKSAWFTPNMEAFLSSIDEAEGVMLSSRHGIITKLVNIDGVDYVCKSQRDDGFLANLFFMSRGVNVWNNAYLAERCGIPTLKPVALVERRGVSWASSYVIYPYEGRMCESIAKQDGSIIMKIERVKDQLAKKRAIHHDFRLRNILLLDNGELQFIDIDKFHTYPKYSYVFQERLKREVKKFNLNIIEKLDTDERLTPPSFSKE